jgi:hypothetical protein
MEDLSFLRRLSNREDLERLGLLETLFMTGGGKFA